MRDAVDRHRGRDHAGQPARVLVDGRCPSRRARRARARIRIRRKAARSAHRPADPPRRRRFGEGRRPPAARSALLRRHQRAGRAVGAGRAEGIQARGAHSVGRSSERRPRAHPAALARGARFARRGQGRMAQVHVRTRREPAEAEADARLGAQARRRSRQRRADEAHGGAGRASQQDAADRSPSRWRWNTRPACCWPRARSRTTRASRPNFRSRSRRCCRGSTRRAACVRSPELPQRHSSTRCRSARRSASCSRRWAARFRPTSATWSRCWTRSSATARSAPSLATLGKDSQQIRGALQDPRALGRRAAPRPVPGADRHLRKSRDQRLDRGPRAPGRVAVGAGLLHRGGRAAAPRARPPDRSACSPSAWARRPSPSATTAAIRSRLRSRSCATRFPRSSRRCGMRRRTKRRARSFAGSSRTCANDADLIGDDRSRGAGGWGARRIRRGRHGRARRRR